MLSDDLTKSRPADESTSGFAQIKQNSAVGSVHDSSYMKRLRLRQELKLLKNNIIFGLTLGWVLTIVGAFKSWILCETGLAYIMFSLGVCFLGVTLLLPNLNSYPQSFMKKIGTFFGTNVFKIIISAVYFLTILPAGLLYQKKHGCIPFYKWDVEKPASIEGWTDKLSSAESTAPSGLNLPGWLQPLQVVSYFIFHSELIFLPCLILLLLLGLIGVFVQSSALAPFIYTLF